MAQRYLRKDIAGGMKKIIKEMEVIDFDDFLTNVEIEAEKIETNLCRYLGEVNEEERIPVFNFEVN